MPPNAPNYYEEIERLEPLAYFITYNIILLMAERIKFIPYVVSHEHEIGSVEVGVKSNEQTIPTKFVWNEQLFRRLKIGIATVRAHRLASRLNKAKPIDAK